MKLLIIEDEPSLGELLQDLVLMADRKTHRLIEAVFLAENLDDAERVLDGFERGDAVICDGRFPTGQPLPTVTRAQAGAQAKKHFHELPRTNWPHITGICEKHGFAFLLYSGDAEMVERAEKSGLAALPKPSPAEAVYVALLDARSGLGLAA